MVEKGREDRENHGRENQITSFSALRTDVSIIPPPRRSFARVLRRYLQIITIIKIHKSTLGASFAIHFRKTLGF